MLFTIKRKTRHISEESVLMVCFFYTTGILILKTDSLKIHFSNKFKNLASVKKLKPFF